MPLRGFPFAEQIHPLGGRLRHIRLVSFHETPHGMAEPGAWFSNNHNAEFVFRNNFPHEPLAGLKSELHAQSGRHGDLSALSKRCEGAGHVKHLSCNDIMSSPEISVTRG